MILLLHVDDIVITRNNIKAYACGGWLETEEETELKNHLRWAQIKAKGLLEKIPTTVVVEDGEWTFTLLIWCETPVKFRRNSVSYYPSDDVLMKNAGKEIKRIFSAESEMKHQNGKETAVKNIADIKEDRVFYTMDNKGACSNKNEG